MTKQVSGRGGGKAAIKKLTKKEKEAMAALGRTELPVDDET